MGRPKCFDRNEVMDSAIQLFWQKGFAETSVQDLEKQTGVNKSGLYSEFKNKDDLYLSSLQHYVSNNDAFDILSREPLGWDNIETFMKSRGGQLCKGCFVANSIREISILPDGAKDIVNSFIKKTGELIAKNLAGKTKLNPLEVADLIMIFNAGLAIGENMNSGGNKAKSAKRIETFLSLLR